MEVLRRLALPILAGFLLGLPACTQKPEDPGSGSPVAPDDVAPVPSNVSVEVTASSVTLTWQIADATGVTQYRVYRAAGNAELRWIASTTSLTYTDSDVIRNTTYRYQIAAVKAGYEGLRSATVAALPANFGLVLEGGAEATAARSISPGSRQIRVDLVAPSSTASVRLSEDPAFPGAVPRPFDLADPVETFALSAGDGTKTVYARYTSEGGALSEVVSSSIVLDTKAVISLVTEDSSDQILLVNDVLHLAVTVDAPGGSVQADLGTAVLGLVLFDDGTNGDGTPNDGVYERDFTITAGVEVVEGPVVAHFEDTVGNVADPRSSATKVTIADPPSPVTFDGAASDAIGASMRLVWTRNLDPDFAEYQIYRSPPGQGSVDTNDAQVATIMARGTLTFTDKGLVGGTQYTWGVVAVDGNGFSSSLSALTRAVDFDPVLTGTTLSPDVGPEGTTFQYDCVYRHPSGLAPQALTVLVDGGQVYAMSQVGSGTNWVGGEPFRVTANLAAGGHTYAFVALAIDGSRTRSPLDEAASFNGPLVTP
jgi:hypothetical protein